RLWLDDAVHGQRVGIAKVGDALPGAGIREGEADGGRALILDALIWLDHPALAFGQEAPHRRVRATGERGRARAEAIALRALVHGGVEVVHSGPQSTPLG